MSPATLWERSQRIQGKDHAVVIKKWRRSAVVAGALLALGAPMAAAAPALADYQRIVNGDFAAGQDPWWTGAGTSGQVTGGEFCVNVTGGTVNGYDALAGQNGVPYEAGQSYTLR